MQHAMRLPGCTMVLLPAVLLLLLLVGTALARRLRDQLQTSMHVLQVGVHCVICCHLPLLPQPVLSTLHMPSLLASLCNS